MMLQSMQKVAAAWHARANWQTEHGRVTCVLMVSGNSGCCTSLKRTIEEAIVDAATEELSLLPASPVLPVLIPRRARVMLGYFPLLLWVAVLSAAVGIYDITLVQV
jgi:hypothetical protein